MDYNVQVLQFYESEIILIKRLNGVLQRMISDSDKKKLQPSTSQTNVIPYKDQINELEMRKQTLLEEIKLLNMRFSSKLPSINTLKSKIKISHSDFEIQNLIKKNSSEISMFFYESFEQIHQLMTQYDSNIRFLISNFNDKKNSLVDNRIADLKGQYSVEVEKFKKTSGESKNDFFNLYVCERNRRLFFYDKLLDYNNYVKNILVVHNTESNKNIKSIYSFELEREIKINYQNQVEKYEFDLIQQLHQHTNTEWVEEFLEDLNYLLDSSNMSFIFLGNTMDLLMNSFFNSFSTYGFGDYLLNTIYQQVPDGYDLLLECCIFSLNGEEIRDFVSDDLDVVSIENLTHKFVDNIEETRSIFNSAYSKYKSLPPNLYAHVIFLVRLILTNRLEEAETIESKMSIILLHPSECIKQNDSKEIIQSKYTLLQSIKSFNSIFHSLTQQHRCIPYGMSFFTKFLFDTISYNSRVRIFHNINNYNNDYLSNMSIIKGSDIYRNISLMPNVGGEKIVIPLVHDHKYLLTKRYDIATINLLPSKFTSSYSNYTTSIPQNIVDSKRLKSKEHESLLTKLPYKAIDANNIKQIIRMTKVKALPLKDPDPTLLRKRAKSMLSYSENSTPIKHRTPTKHHTSLSSNIYSNNITSNNVGSVNVNREKKKRNSGKYITSKSSSKRG